MGVGGGKGVGKPAVSNVCASFVEMGTVQELLLYPKHSSSPYTAPYFVGGVKRKILAAKTQPENPKHTRKSIAAKQKHRQKTKSNRKM